MPPIQFGPVLPVSAIEPKSARTPATGNLRPGTPASPAAGASASDALDPGAPPVDAERVQLIRKAIEAGTYPILPAKVADAMIAAGLLLRSAR